MRPDRLWMYEGRLRDGFLTEEFVDNLEKFIEFACSHPECMRDGKIRCPCPLRNCKNKCYLDVETVKVHIAKNGFKQGYYDWNFHGENESHNIDTQCDQHAVDMSSSDNVDVNINSYERMIDDVVEAQQRSTFEEPPNPEAQKFYDLIQSAKRKLWNGCPNKHTQLSATVKLLEIKSKHQASHALFNDICQLFQEVLPDDNLMPKDFYSAKKLVQGLGLPVEVIRVRNRKPRPSVTKEVWASWQEKWKDGNYKTKCEQNSRNRKSEKCGPGTGMSKHSCGSRSMIAHQKALTVKIGRKPNAFELHKYTHMKRKDGENSEWTDQRSQMVAERYQEKLNVANQRVEEGALEAQSVNEDEIFLDAADGLKKQKVYGLGTCGPIYYPKLNAGSKYSRTQQSFSESQEFQDTLAREVAQVKAHMEMQMQERENQLQAMMQERELQMQNQMWERESQLQSQVQVQMEAQMNAHLKAQADMEARIQQRMEAMMSSMGVRTTTSSSTAQNAETSGAI